MMSSNDDGPHVNTMGIRGIPVKCECGRNTVIKTSKTKENPGRPFFRCPTFRDDHLFKWVEDSVYEELEDALQKVGYCESDICKTKLEIEGIKSVTDELMEDLRKGKVELERLLEDALRKVGYCESDIWKTKADIEGIKSVNDKLMEEVRKAKVELKRLNLFMKVGFGAICFFIILCIILILFGKSSGLSLSSY